MSQRRKINCHFPIPAPPCPGKKVPRIRLMPQGAFQRWIPTRSPKGRNPDADARYQHERQPIPQPQKQPMSSTSLWPIKPLGPSGLLRTDFGNNFVLPKSRPQNRLKIIPCGCNNITTTKETSPRLMAPHRDDMRRSM